MPLDYLWSESDIARGNPEVIVNLLDQIRKAYGQKMAAVVRKKEVDNRIRKQVRDVSAAR